MTLDEYCSLAEGHASQGNFSSAFDSALQGLLSFEHTDSHSEECYNTLFRHLVMSSKQLCDTTDFDTLVKQRIEESEKNYSIEVALAKDDSLEDDAKWTADEHDQSKITIKYGEGPSKAYKILRELIRFEMYTDSVKSGKEHEVCCTETNFKNLMNKIRADLEKIVPADQREYLDSMGQSIYSDFTSFFICATSDMIVDSKIYAMKEFRPLQLNVMGKEARSNVKIVNMQNNKAQKSEIVTNWFKAMLVLPSFLFKKLYSVSLLGMVENSSKQVSIAYRMFEILEKSTATFNAGDEYKIMQSFLKELNLENCFTIRPRQQAKKPMVN